MTEELEPQQEPKKKGAGVYIAIIILLTLGLGYTLYLLSVEKDNVNNIQAENDKLNADMEGMNQMLEGYVGSMSNDLKTDFQNMLATYDALMTKDEGKTEELQQQKERIQNLMNELETSRRNGSITARQLVELRRENETLRKIMKDYVVQIDALNTLNLKLESVLDSTSTQLNVTKDDRDRLAKESEGQKTVIDRAKKLQAHSFKSGALRAKINSSMAETNKANNAAQLVSNFTISENTVAATGSTSVYMQIIDPSGKTLQSRSGNVVSTSSGSVAYTDMKTINYTGDRIDVAIYYNLNDQEIDKGNYKVKIYCQGELIGTDSFTLK